MGSEAGTVVDAEVEGGGDKAESQGGVAKSS